MRGICAKIRYTLETIGMHATVLPQTNDRTTGISAYVQISIG